MTKEVHSAAHHDATLSSSGNSIEISMMYGPEYRYKQTSDGYQFAPFLTVMLSYSGF